MSPRDSLVMGGTRAVHVPSSSHEVSLGRGGKGLKTTPPNGGDEAPEAFPGGHAGAGEVSAADTSAPFKRERRRRSDEHRVSMFGLRDLWLMPYLGEVVLMFGASWMSYCLWRVVQDPTAGFPLGSVMVLAVAYAGLAIYSRLHELFLPRKVVFLGVGGLLLISVGVSGAVFSDAYLMGGRPRMMNAALVLTPVHLFILRCLLIFREARYTPAADKLAMRLKCKGDKIDELRRKLRFWMS